MHVVLAAGPTLCALAWLQSDAEHQEETYFGWAKCTLACQHALYSTQHHPKTLYKYVPSYPEDSARIRGVTSAHPRQWGLWQA